MTREIPLTHGLVALVSDEDYEELSRYVWYATRSATGTWVAMRHAVIDGKRVSMLMHTQITGFARVRHIDNDNLNNCRSNLCEMEQPDEGGLHRKPRGKYTSEYKGVSWVKPHSRWKAVLRARGAYFYLGEFKCQEDAARAYDKKAREVWGPNACVNFPVDGERWALERQPAPSVPSLRSTSRRKARNGKSRFKNVALTPSNRWAARLRHGSKMLHLGIYESAEEAARVVDEKTRELFGSTRTYNFPEPGERSALE